MLQTDKKKLILLLDFLKHDINNEILDETIKEDLIPIFEAYKEIIRKDLYGIQRNGIGNSSKVRK